MAFSARVEYTGDGSSNAWTVSFPYLKKSHVTLTVDGVPDATFTWITDSSIAATSIPGDGVAVVIQRVTPRNALDTTIPASGTFRGADLNNQATQALYVADEAYDEISVPTSGTLITGTPADNQIPVFVSANTIEGGTGLTYDGATLDVTGNFDISGNIVVGGTVDGVDVATLKTDFDALTHDGLSGFVANEHIDWTSASSNLVTSGNVTADTVTAASVAGDVAAGFTPGGRLTATSGERVQSSIVTAGTAIYYTPAIHGFVPLYDGTSWEVHEFTELTNTFSDATKNPAATALNSNYDLFVWDDAGTVRLSRGPAWTDNTNRSAGTALATLNGRLVNNLAITNGPLANRGLYVGSFRTNGSNQLEARLFTNGAACNFLFQNWYNRVPVTLVNDYSGSSHTYGTNSARRLAGDAATDFGIFNCGEITRLHGQVEITSGFGGVGSGRAAFGLGNGENTFSMTLSYGDSDGITSTTAHSGEMAVGIGFRVIRTLEIAPTGTYTAYRGDSKGYIRWMI